MSQDTAPAAKKAAKHTHLDKAAGVQAGPGRAASGSLGTQQVELA